MPSSHFIGNRFLGAYRDQALDYTQSYVQVYNLTKEGDLQIHSIWRIQVSLIIQEISRLHLICFSRSPFPIGSFLFPVTLPLSMQAKTRESVRWHSDIDCCPQKRRLHSASHSTGTVLQTTKDILRKKILSKQPRVREASTNWSQSNLKRCI